MHERNHRIEVRVSEEERAHLEALEHAEDASASALVRRWIRQHYEARFGAPPPKAASSRR